MNKSDDADPVGVSEIAQRLGVKAQTVSVWRLRHPEFPLPRWTVGGADAWDWQDIKKWAEETGRL